MVAVVVEVDMTAVVVMVAVAVVQSYALYSDLDNYSRRHSDENHRLALHSVIGRVNDCMLAFDLDRVASDQTTVYH